MEHQTLGGSSREVGREEERMVKIVSVGPGAMEVAELQGQQARRKTKPICEGRKTTREGEL